MSVSAVSAMSGVQQLSSDLANLGPELSNVAPTGGFGAVFSQITSDIASIDSGDSGVASAASSPPTSETVGNLIGSGSPTVSAEGAATGTPTGRDVVADAEQYLGVPYQWGGTNPATGLDCSGLVQRVYADLGVDLPRTSEQQATVGTAVPNLASAQPGDLVFFEPSSSGPGHVGIYVGNGEMIDAPHTGTDVQIQAVGQPSEIRRVLPSTGPAPASSAAAPAVVAAAQGETSPAMSALGVPPGLQPLFTEAGSRYGIDPTVLAAVAKQESGFQTGVVSGAGAQGIMQLMPATAAGLGVSPFDPASAIDGAAQLLSNYLQEYGGSVPDALAAYNAGPGAVATYGGVPPYAETEHYVSSITSMLASVGDGSL